MLTHLFISKDSASQMSTVVNSIMPMATKSPLLSVTSYNLILQNIET
jgi:hypothetical protein